MSETDRDSTVYIHTYIDREDDDVMNNNNNNKIIYIAISIVVLVCAFMLGMWIARATASPTPVDTETKWYELLEDIDR